MSSVRFCGRMCLSGIVRQAASVWRYHLRSDEGKESMAAHWGVKGFNAIVN